MRGIRDSALINLFNLHRTVARGFRLEKEAVIAMRSVPEEIDFAFRALYILLEDNPNVNPEVLEITRQKVSTNIAASVQQPQFEFLHQTNEARWPGRIFGNLNLSVDDLTIVDVDWVNAMSQRLWRNVNGAWFLISGPIDAETIEEYVTKYLGGLEGVGRVGNRSGELGTKPDGGGSVSGWRGSCWGIAGNVVSIAGLTCHRSSIVPRASSILAKPVL